MVNVIKVTGFYGCGQCCETDRFLVLVKVVKLTGLVVAAK